MLPQIIIKSWKRNPINSLKGVQFSYAMHTQAARKQNQNEKVTNNYKQSNANVDTSEINHHAKFAKDWWNPNGPMKGLHALNEIRIPFIRDGLLACGNINKELIKTPHVLTDQRILDVGCGAGILSEHLARLGAEVTGIDLGEDVVEAARTHLAEKSPELCDKIEYKIEPIELHAKDRTEYYDAVVASELLEHVSDKVGLLSACVQSLKPGGSIFITTLNKTVLMWVGGVFMAEYVLNLVPKGTHHWDKLISPIDVQRILDTLNCHTVMVNGSTYDFWRNSWRWINSTNLCYALHAVKANKTL